MPTPTPDVNDLTDLASVESFLALPSGNADEALLQTLITGVSAEIVTYCERQFSVQTYTETRNGDGRHAMNFLNPPCSTVTSLTVDTKAVAAASDALASGYSFDVDQISVRGFGPYPFTRGFQNVSIVYSAGYFTPGMKAAGQSQSNGVPALPADVKMAATELVALRYRQSKRWGDTGFGVGTERVNYFTGDMPLSTKLKLNRYRGVAPVEV